MKRKEQKKKTKHYGTSGGRAVETALVLRHRALTPLPRCLLGCPRDAVGGRSIASLD